MIRNDGGWNNPDRPLLTIAGSTSTYNLASGVVTLIAKGTTDREANSLMRLLEGVESGMFRSIILAVLEPLAERL